ncbi:MAG: hypothetical protein IT330_03625 [Anaerolineae bacterium]|nr:hypothetical protein [Anaerolineae bacterium]
MRRCLILGCSAKKVGTEGLVPAIKRYDGPLFRVLRRYGDERPSDPPDVYILSAEFGLVSSNYPLPLYERRMTRQRAQELQPDVLAALRHIFTINRYEMLLICMGADYRRALAGYEDLISPETRAEVCTGTMGKMQTGLYEWLYGSPPASLVATARRGCVRIRGVELAMTPEQVLNLARLALAEGRGDPSRYGSWCVMIDGQPVAPKWLVSQLTGLPVSAFHAADARRALAQLGLQVMRT